MEFLDLAVRFTEEEERLARDVFSGKLKKMVLPYCFPEDDLREFILVAEGTKPGVAVVKVADLSYTSLGNLLRNIGSSGLADYGPMLRREHWEDSDPTRICTLIEIGEVAMIPMDFAEVQNSRYLQGSLREEGDMENSSAFGKLPRT